MVYGEGAIAERFRSDSPPLSLNERTTPMAAKTMTITGRHEVSRKLCGFPSRRWAAFFFGMLIGTVVVGCSMFGPGLGVSVY